MLKDDFLREETMQVILQRWLQAHTFCKPWHEQIQRWRRLYEFDHYTTPRKEDEARYNDPTYTNVVDLAVGIIVANDLEFRAIGWVPSDEEEKATSQVEKYLLGIIGVNDEREETRTESDLDMYFVRDGAGVIYSCWDPRLEDIHRIWIKVPSPDSQDGIEMKEGYAEPPIMLRVIDPLQMTMLPGGPNRWLHVFRTTEMTVYDVESIYGVSLQRFSHIPKEMKQQTKGKFLDYWRVAEVDEVMYHQGQVVMNEVLGRPETKPTKVVINAVIFENEFVFAPRLMPGYEDIPYTIDFFKPVDRTNPKDWGHGILRPLETSVAELESSVNRRAHQIDVYSSLPLVVKAQSGHTVNVDPGFAKVTYILPDEDVAFPQWPGNPPDVPLHIDFLRSRVQQSGFADVMYGMSTSQAAGYALSQLGDQNRIRIEPPLKRLEQLWSRWAKKVLRLTRNFAAEKLVRVYGRMRGKDFTSQIMGAEIADYLVRCRIKPKFPNDKVRNVSMATQVAPFLSKRTIMEEYLDIEQPDDEREKQLIDMALEHPLMQTYGMMKVLMEKADAGDEAAKQTIMAFQQGQVGSNQGGRPKEPSNPQQPLGLQSPTGQPAPQAVGQQPPGQSEADMLGQAIGAAPQMSGAVQ